MINRLTVSIDGNTIKTLDSSAVSTVESQRYNEYRQRRKFYSPLTVYTFYGRICMRAGDYSDRILVEAQVVDRRTECPKNNNGPHIYRYEISPLGKREKVCKLCGHIQ